MELVNFGHFKFTSVDRGAMMFTNEDGQDWYDLRANLTTWDEQGNFLTSIYGAWATVDPATMLVANVESDPSRLVPNDRIVLGMDTDAALVLEGMLYSNGHLVQAPAKPETFKPVTRRQLRLTLVRNKIPLAAVDAAIAAMPEGLEKDEATIEWQDALEFERHHPTLNALAKQLGLSPALVDKMWREAEAIASPTIGAANEAQE